MNKILGLIIIGLGVYIYTNRRKNKNLSKKLAEVPVQSKVPAQRKDTQENLKKSYDNIKINEEKLKNTKQDINKNMYERHMYAGEKIANVFNNISKKDNNSKLNDISNDIDDLLKGE